jgi:hypothetical protein
MKQIELNETEAEALLNFIDTAIKVQGLKVANDALILSNKIIEAFNNDDQ